MKLTFQASQQSLWHDDDMISKLFTYSHPRQTRRYATTLTIHTRQTRTSNKPYIPTNQELTINSIAKTKQKCKRNNRKADEI